DMEELDKMKINITTIIEDSISFEINYTIWDWIRYNESFISSPLSEYNYTYLKNPGDYPPNYNLTNKIPFILPSPALGYLSVSNLDSNYDLTYETEVLFELEWREDHGDEDYLRSRAIYNNRGILTDFEILLLEYIPSGDYWSGRSYFEMHLFYETGPKPNYVDFNVDDVLEYGIYFCPKFIPDQFITLPAGSPTSGILNFTIDFISGEDPFLKRVFVILNLYGTYDLNFIYGDTTNATAQQLFTVNSEFLVANNTDWTILCNKLNERYSSSSSVFSPLSNGFIWDYDYSGLYFKIEQIYFANGTLQFMNYYNKNGNLFMTLRHNEFDYKMYCPSSDSGGGGGGNDDKKDSESISGADILIIQISILISILGLISYYKRKK
ncbi:MAG: hypothetical protein ACFFAO_16310, partial [Candidatus Hermodarchaeota archaeon]